MSPSKNFTKITIAVEDRPAFDALQRQLTMKAQGRAVSQAEVVNWLIKLGHQAIAKGEVKLTKPGEPSQGQE